MRLMLSLAVLVFAAGLSGCDGQSVGAKPAGPKPDGAKPTAASAAAPVARELDWDDMMPKDWEPDALLEPDDVSRLDDTDRRAKDLLGKLKRRLAEAPVVPALDGELVRLPGFVVPLEIDGTKISEFLLVPYYGACIHVPPPPANQTVYVRLPPELAFAGKAFDTIWVTGTLKVTPTSSELADAGYRIEATMIAPYTGTLEPL